MGRGRDRASDRTLPRCFAAMSNQRTPVPPYYRVMRCYSTDKTALKQRSREVMRALERASRDALRHGADPDADTPPMRSREAADEWGFD